MVRSFGALTLGCSGGVLAAANVAPKMCVRIMDLIKTGKYEAARKLQLKLLPVNNAVTFIYGVPGLKVALDLLRILWWQTPPAPATG